MGVEPVKVGGVKSTAAVVFPGVIFDIVGSSGATENSDAPAKLLHAPYRKLVLRPTRSQHGALLHAAHKLLN